MCTTVDQFKAAHPNTYQRLRFDLLPGHMAHGFAAYVILGQPMGHFGTAALADQLVMAFAYADETNTARMADTAGWLYNHCPIEARGSQAKVDAWIALGGLVGWMKKVEGE